MAGTIIGEILLALGLDTDPLKKKKDEIPGLFQGLGAKVTAAAGLAAIGIALKASFDAFNSLESHLKTLRQYGEDDQSLRGITDQINELSTEVPLARDEFLELAESLSEAGLRGEDLETALGFGSKLATLGVDADTTAGLVDALGESFGLTGKSAAGAFDVITKGSQIGGTSFASFAGAVKDFAPDAQTLGMSLDEVAAAIVVFETSGREGGQSLEALNRVFKEASKDGQTLELIMNKLGVDMSTNAIQTKGLMPVMMEFGSKLEDYKAKGGDASEIINKLGKNTEGIGSIMTLVSEGGMKKYKDATDALAGSTGTLDKAVEANKATFDGQWTMLMNSFLPVLEAIGEMFMIIIIPALKAISPLLRLVADYMADWAQELSYSIKTIGGWIETSIEYIKSAWGWYSGYLDGVLEFFDKIAFGIGKVFGVVSDSVGPVINWLSGLFDTVSPAISETTAAAESASGIIETINEKLAEFIKTTFGAIYDFIKPVMDFLIEVHTFITEKILGLINDVAGLVKGAWSWFTEGYDENKAAEIAAGVVVSAQEAAEKVSEVEEKARDDKATAEKTARTELSAEEKKAAEERAKAAKKATEERIKAEKDLWGNLYDWMKAQTIDWTKIDKSDLDKLQKDIEARRKELEKSLALKPSIATENAIKQLDDFELTVKAQATIANAELKMKPDIDPSNLDNVQPVLEEKILIPMRDIRDQVELDINDGFNIFKMRLTESLDEVAVAGRGAIEDEFVSLFQGEGFSFSNVLKTLENSLFSQLAGMAADAVVGKDGKGGIMGTITGALGVTGPVGMAIMGGVSVLWSTFFNKPHEESLFIKLGNEIRDTFTESMEGFWDNFAAQAYEALADTKDQTKLANLVKSYFDDLYKAMKTEMGKFNLGNIFNAIFNDLGASQPDEFLKKQLKDWFNGVIEYADLDQKLKDKFESLFGEYFSGISSQITVFIDGWQNELQSMMDRGLITEGQYNNALYLIQQYGGNIQQAAQEQFQEFIARITADPGDYEAALAEYRSALDWLFADLRFQYKNYEDLIASLTKKVGDSTSGAAAQATQSTQALIDAYVKAVESGIMTLDQISLAFGQDFADKVAKALEEAADDETITEAARNVGKDVAATVSDGVSAGLDENDPLAAINKAIEAGTNAWQRNLLNAYNIGKTLSEDGIENLKDILQGLLDSGAVTVSDLVALYGAGVAELLGYTVEQAKTATEDIASDVGDIVQNTQDAIDQIGRADKDAAEAGLDTGPDTISVEDQITAAKNVIAAIQAEYDNYYDAIDRRIDYQQSLIEAKIQTELDGVNEVLAAMTERYEREIDYLANNNTESQNSLEDYLDTIDQISDLMGKYEDEGDDIAKQQSEIWSDLAKNIASGISDVEKAIKSSTNLTEELGDVNKENVSYLDSILKNYQSIEDVLKPINKENQNQLNTILKNYTSIDDILKDINKSNGDNIKYLIEQSGFDKEILTGYKDRLKGILLISDEEQKAIELKALAIELQSQGVDISRLDLETQENINAITDDQLKAYQVRLDTIKNIADEELKTTELKKLALELQQNGIDISSLDLETQQGLNIVNEEQIKSFQSRLSLIKTISDENEKQVELQKLLSDMQKAGFGGDLTLSALENMQGLTEAEREYYAERINSINQINNDIEKQSALESIINELKDKGIDIDYESINALVEINKLNQEYAEKFAEVKKQMEEAARAYNQEELENLESVNAANASIVAYKIQQSDLSADQQAKYQAQLEAALSISDAQERQKALMELANQLSAAGVDINLQDYQLMQMKTDLTAEEVKAMAEKAELAKEAIKDMNEDLAIQRQRLQDAGLPTLEIEKQMAILKQEQLAKIAEQLGIDMDQLSVMDSQLIKTEEQKKANLELAQQQISALNQELSQMEANGASQEEINAARIAALQAISGNLGIEQSTLGGLLNQQNALQKAEEQKLAYQQAQLDALNGVKSATESMRDVMQGLQTTISNLAIALQGIANTNIDQPARDLDSAIQGAGYDANSLRDTLGSINDMTITPNFNIPKDVLETLDVGVPSFDVGSWMVPSDMLANIHAGEMIVPSDVADQIRSMGLINRDLSGLNGQTMGSQNIISISIPVAVTGNNISSDLDIMDIADRVSERIGKTIKAGVLV